MVIGSVLPVNASGNVETVEECIALYLNGTGCDEEIPLSDEEIESLGGSESVEYDPEGLGQTIEITRESFESDEEYEQYLLDNTFMTPFYFWMLPVVLPVVTRVSGQLLVRQTLTHTMRNITIRNGALANTVHPVTKVRFNANGFPIFNARVQVQIDEALMKSSNAVQFRNANQKLLIEIQTNATVRSKFTASEITQIKNLQTPAGHTWHHHQNRQLMQLVNTTIHQQTGHTGGRAIWGTL